VSRSTCIFCLQAKKLEAEHAWSLWIERLLSAPGRSFTVQQLLPAITVPGNPYRLPGGSLSEQSYI
jgi:hypothetical protein